MRLSLYNMEELLPTLWSLLLANNEIHSSLLRCNVHQDALGNISKALIFEAKFKIEQLETLIAI